MVDVRTDRLDDARALGSRREWQMLRIKAAAMIDVDKIEPDSFLPEPDLPGAGLSDIDLFPLQDLGASNFMDSNGVRHGSASNGFGPKREARSRNFLLPLHRGNRAAGGPLGTDTDMSAIDNLPIGGAFANARGLPGPNGAFMSTSPVRTLKGTRRLQRRHDRRSPSPQWQFLRGFLKNPVMVGSVIPSSRVLIEKMLDPVDWANTKVFVEYGPGVGTFTRHVLNRLLPDATLVTIDTHPDFTGYLKDSLDDERLVTVTGSAADVEKILADRNLGSADYVLSGLPFSTLPPGVGEDIAEATANVIRPGGAFLVYQFSPKVFDFIKPHFDQIKRGFEWINVPPAVLFWAYKAEPA